MKRWNEEQENKLGCLLLEGKTYQEAASELGRSPKAIKVKAHKLGIHYSPLTEATKETVSCLTCKTYFTALISEARKFCSSSCAAKTSNTKRSKGPRSFECVNCSKVGFSKQKGRLFCDRECESAFKFKVLIKEVENGTASARRVKKYLLSIKGSVCFECRNTKWLGHPIPLELEHVDGNHKNNKLNNVKLLCPNCHALTATYKGKNKGNGRHFRRDRYAKGESY